MNENLSDMNESNESAGLAAETLPATKTQRLGKYMLETLKEMYQSLRYPEFKFAISGIIMAVVLVLVSILFFILPYLVNNGEPIQLPTFAIPPNLIGIPISLVLASLVIYFWFLLGFKITPKAAHYLVDNKFLKLVFTGGHVHYLEYVPLEKRKIAFPHILNKFIVLLIAWVSVSAFLLNLVAGIIAEGNPTRILNPGNDIIAFLVREIILFIFVPLVFTLIYPLGWMLMDAKLKAFNSATKLNWLVGKKVANLTGGFITIASLFALGADAVLSAEVAGDILARIQIIIDLVLFCIINVSLIIILVAIFYNIFFHGKFYQMIIDSIEVGFGITSVTLTDEFGKVLPEPESEPAAGPEPKLEIEPEPEPEPEPKPEFEPEQTFESEEE
ncbi:MAG: hypothetical protein ACFE8U_04950 [Candidatus Hermodarchaeota archaeon]